MESCTSQLYVILQALPPVPPSSKNAGLQRGTHKPVKARLREVQPGLSATLSNHFSGRKQLDPTKRLFQPPWNYGKYSFFPLITSWLLIHRNTQYSTFSKIMPFPLFYGKVYSYTLYIEEHTYKVNKVTLTVSYPKTHFYITSYSFKDYLIFLRILIFVYKVFLFIAFIFFFFFTQNTNSSFPGGPESSTCITVMILCPLGVLTGLYRAICPALNNPIPLCL